MTGRSWTLTDDAGRPLTINRVADLHRQQWATHTRATRERWAWLALAAHIPHLERVRIVATPLHKDGRSPQDALACAPEVKAAVDGLRDARVLDDDNPRFVTSVKCTAPDICGTDGLRLLIEEVLS